MGGKNSPFNAAFILLLRVRREIPRHAFSPRVRKERVR
jgi:hypothetical protein